MNQLRVFQIVNWGQNRLTPESAAIYRAKATKILSPDVKPEERAALLAEVGAMAKAEKFSADYILGELTAELESRRMTAEHEARRTADAKRDAELSAQLRRSEGAKAF